MTKRVAVYIKTESCDEDLELLEFNVPEDVVNYYLVNRSENPYYWSHIMVAGDDEDEIRSRLLDLRKNAELED